MSRIILTKYDDGQQKFVVGWDHPAHGCFWQEFSQEPAEGEPYPDDWEEVIRHGGMWPGIPLSQLRAEIPEDLRPLVTDDVIGMLYRHARDPESGRNPPVDMSNQEESHG
jgi:hypothetical protein